MKKKSNQLSEREIARRREQAAKASAEAEKSGSTALDTKSGGKPVQPSKAKEFRHQGR